MSDTFVINRAGGAPIATELPCGHVFWGKPSDDCPVCAQIKAAEDKRGKEVLEWVLGKMIKFAPLHESKFRNAYRERFGS